jgi:hypothetical protein
VRVSYPLGILRNHFQFYFCGWRELRSALVTGLVTAARSLQHVHSRSGRAALRSIRPIPVHRPRVAWHERGTFPRASLILVCIVRYDSAQKSTQKISSNTLSRQLTTASSVESLGGAPGPCHESSKALKR